MVDESFTWRWADTDFTIGLTRKGSGPTVLLLPALSSISTRTEMAPLQMRLADRYNTIAIDLPGFGSAAKPPMAWIPDAYRAFLRQIFADFRPFATIAAGHTASYALECESSTPGTTGCLALISPTWRGPLPTMLERRPAFLSKLARFADRPFLGALLYRLNVNRPAIGMMARGHVYSDPAWLNEERMAEKLKVTESPGARHASVRFVCGELDPFTEHAAFLSAVKQLREEVLVIYGTNVPRRSLAEIMALQGFVHIHMVAVAGAKLAVHEEFPDKTAAALAPFLAKPSPGDAEASRASSG